MKKELKEFLEQLIESNYKDYKNIDIEESEEEWGVEYKTKGFITVFYTDEDLKCLTPKELKEFLELKYFYAPGIVEREFKEYDEYFTEDIDFNEIEYQFKKMENRKDVA